MSGAACLWSPGSVLSIFPSTSFVFSAAEHKCTLCHCQEAVSEAPELLQCQWSHCTVQWGFPAG
jgi:hypothetical protein